MHFDQKLNRQYKVASLINEALVEVLQKGRMLDKHLLKNPITVTKVLVASDFKIANCYFIPFNTHLSVALIMEALNKSKSAIRSLVTRIIKLRYSPELRFFYDRGFDNALKVEEILKSISNQ